MDQVAQEERTRRGGTLRVMSDPRGEIVIDDLDWVVNEAEVDCRSVTPFVEPWTE